MANGKVCTGFSKPYVAKYNASGGSVTYTQGQILARGVNVSMDPETSDDNNFHADNQLAESASGTFTGATLTLTVDGLKVAAERFIMGLPSPGADGFTAYGDDQNVPYIGVGFIARYMEDGVTTYTPIVIAKTKFNQVSTSAATQEDEIDWQTQEITAVVMRGDDSNHNWKYIGGDYASESAAEDALKAKLGISSTVSFSVTQNFTNITSNFSDDTIESGDPLSATLTPTSTYTIDSVTVTMGGIDITAMAYDDGAVTIEAVTGNVVITAAAVQGA